MARNSASVARPDRKARRFRVVRPATAAALWLAVVVFTQGALGADLGDALRGVEDGIERQLRPPSTVQDPPPRSSEPDPIEPWELVSV